MNADLDEWTRPIILMVEDHPAVAKVLSGMLCSTGGYDTENVGSAEDALVLLSEDRPNLVMIDINLPGHNGLWLLAQIHVKWPALPTMILTGYASLAFKEEAFASGARAYVLKDDVHGILEAIHAALTGGTYVSAGVSGDEEPPSLPGFPTDEP